MSSTRSASSPPSNTRHANANRDVRASILPPSPAPDPDVPLQQSNPSWWSRLGVDHWEWELAAALLCVCVLASIVGVLISYDQRSVPDLPIGLTLNAIISFLSTLAKSSLTLILGAAIRQEKWLWFIKQPRPLSSIDDFEEASRGPYGSLVLVFKGRGGLRTLLAAATTVLALGFEPFLQQVVTVSVRDVVINGAIASIQTPTVYNESVIGDTAGSSLSLNAQIGAFGGANGTIQTPICPSGNCTWPHYDTLALCTVCKDMTDEIEVSNAVNLDLAALLADYESGNESDYSQQWQPSYSFPGGYNVSVDVALSMVNSSGTYIMTQWGMTFPRRVVWPLNISPEPNSYWDQTWRNDTFADMDSSLFVLGYLDLNMTEDSSSLRTQRATECAFNPCVRTMSTQVVNGNVESDVTATDYGAVFFDRRRPDGSTLSAGWSANVSGTNYEIVDSGGSGNVRGHAYLLIQALRIAIEGNTTYSLQGYHYPNGEFESTVSQSTGFSQTAGPWSSAGQQAIDGADDFTSVVEGIGQALTGRFQQLARSSVSGSATQSEAIVVVRWIWLIYPMTLLVLGVADLVATITATHFRHMAVWKESALPLLYRYTGTTTLATPAGQTRFSRATTLTNHISQIVDDAHGEMVQLRRHHTVWTLDPQAAFGAEATVKESQGRRKKRNTRDKNADANIYLEDRNGIQLQAPPSRRARVLPPGEESSTLNGNGNPQR